MRSWISINLRSFKVLAALALSLGASAFLWAYEIKDDREVSNKKPVNISASQLTFDRLKGLTLFKGAVKATHNSVILTSEEMRAMSENKEATADGHVKVVDPTAAMTLTCGNLEYQDLMNTMTAHDHPVMLSLDENGKPITIEGRQMELDSEKKVVVINQNVKIYHDDGHAEAQKATFLAKEDKFILEDDPKVFMTNGQLSGRRIVSNLGEDRSVFCEGMADAIFNPNGAPVTGKSAGVSGPNGKGPNGRGAPGTPDSPFAPGTNAPPRPPAGGPAGIPPGR